MNTNLRNINTSQTCLSLINIKEEIIKIRFEFNLQMDDIIDKITGYCDWFYNERFENNQQEKQIDRYKRMETHFDKVHETLVRNEQMRTIGDELVQTFDILQQKFILIKEMSEQHYEEIGNNQNALLKQLREMESQMEMSDEKKKYQMEERSFEKYLRREIRK